MMKKVSMLFLVVLMLSSAVIATDLSFRYLEVWGTGGETTELNPVNNIVSFRSLTKEDLGGRYLYVSAYKNFYGRTYGGVTLNLVDMRSSPWSRYRNRITINADIKAATFEEVDGKKIKEILVERHDFSEERVEKQINRLREVKEKAKQKGLDKWF